MRSVKPSHASTSTRNPQEQVCPMLRPLHITCSRQRLVEGRFSPRKVPRHGKVRKKRVIPHRHQDSLPRSLPRFSRDFRVLPGWRCQPYFPHARFSPHHQYTTPFPLFELLRSIFHLCFYAKPAQAEQMRDVCSERRNLARPAVDHALGSVSEVGRSRGEAGSCCCQMRAGRRRLRIIWV